MKKTYTIQIEGISCGHCVASIQKILDGLNGITASSVDLATGKASIELDSSQLDLQTVIQSINQTEIYTVKSHENENII